MNFDELDDTTVSHNPGHSLDPETFEPRERQSSQEDLGLPSIPSDPEWVSPFTLPPLPALRKSRGQAHLLRSPEERLHQRVSSSAYYAAAWGSPYATPSPSRSPPVLHPGGQSQDLDTASPLSSRVKEVGGNLRDSSQKLSRLAPNSSLKRRRANSWDKQKSLSERFNWLSESDLSGGEADPRIEATPTRDTYLKGLKESGSKITSTRPRTHQMRESTATITPETFHAADGDLIATTDGRDTRQQNMDQEIGDSHEAALLNNGVDKPLPNLPHLSTMEKKAEIVPTTASPDSPSRPRIQTSQSFQRPKRKVPWKGKTCIIALPLTDREEAGLPPLLGFEEVKSRIEKWVTRGHDMEDTKTQNQYDPSGAFGQSRPLYPDPHEMYAERKDSKLHVRIPNQADWDTWVEYLKEEKLRALGVTPSNSEAPMSVQSPFSSTLSRVSSTYPSVAPSPPIGTLSANGNPVHIASNTFSPPLSLSRSGLGSHGGSHAASPSISGFTGPMHGYKQSIAQPRMNSPFDYPVTHPGSFGPGMRNTPNGVGARQFSPPTHPNLQSFGQVLSPIVPTVPSNDNGRGMNPYSTMEQIRQQQQRQQQFHQQVMQHQRQQSYFPPQSKSADPLPRTPVLESPTRHTPEIMHPTPRSHRHNLSAALQKGVDDAEAARGVKQTVEVDEKENVKSIDDDIPEPAIEESAEGATEEEQEPELPVLRRPETLPQDDDKSEIETNPSIAASPMLVDDKNPFATPFSSLQQIKDALQPQSQPQHKPNVSISKLNVEAPTFNPQNAFSVSNFAFGGNAFQPASASAPAPALATTQKQLVGGSRPSFTPKNLSLSKLNVDAPTFTPSFMAQSTPAKESTPAKITPAKQSIATPSKSSFTFSSPAFNVEAPEFKPGQSFSFNAESSVASQENTLPLTSIGSIFGNVVVDANSKVNRRGAKAVPIVRPASTDGEESDAVDDEEGRVGAPSDRQKRARRFGSEEDEALLFAKSAPFDHNEGLSIRSETPAGKSVRGEITASEDIEKTVPELDAIKETSDDKDEAAPATSVSRPGSAANDTEVPATDSTPGAPETTSARAEDKTPEETSDKPAEIRTAITETEEKSSVSTEQLFTKEANQSSDSTPELPSSTSDNSHKAKSSLSALAKPFEFRPPASVEPVKPADPAPSSEPKKSRGLMASRFAATPSPEPEIATQVGKTTSPPRELYEYVRPEDYILDDAKAVKEQSNFELITPKLPNMQFESTPELMKSIEESMRSEGRADGATRTPSQASRVDEPMPSYEEIDAVMKQFETNPDLGVERDDSPIKSTPLVDMRLPPTFRSDAPSPSPRRRTISPQRRADFGLGIHKLSNENDDRSDWDDDFSPQQEHKIHAQAHYFDGRVNGVVENILENRLGPLEHALQSIKHSIALITTKPRSGGRRSISTDKKDSDADDEDDYDAFEGFSSYRSRSPSRGQRKADKIRAAIMEAMAAYQPPVPEQPVLDMSEIRAALDEMRKLSQQASLEQPREQTDMRAVMEEVISSHPRFRTPSNQDDHEAIQETYKLKMDVLESTLREAEKKADEETALRRQTDDDMKQLSRKLLEAQEIAASHREASEEAQVTLQAFIQEKEAHRELKSSYDSLLEKNKALEDLLSEHRATTDQFREDAKLERARNQDLIRVMHNLREDFNDKMESRQALRSQMERLQDRMTQVLQDVHDDEAEWRKKEHELSVQNKTLQAALDHEMRHREKIELELDGLDKEHKENMRYRSQHEHAQHEILRLQQQIAKVTDENKSFQDQSFKLERELTYIKETTDNEVVKATTRLEAELQAARATIESLQVDSEAQIARLQKRVDDAELDLEEQKAKHDSMMTDTVETHSHALHEANQKRENDLEDQHKSHEKKLNDLRERHTRALHNSSDDRHRLEHQLNERLAISEERTTHLQSQVKDLEDRLEVTRSAARAAVEAATAKANNLPTPAPSVVASPPQRLSSASLHMVKGTDIPEKISPQALRESIMVLQEQLQNREQKIEQLEADVAALDKEAPAKIKERDNEITLLRELLSVRVDDLNEIIATLSQPSYDREATKNAAIRLKANLQMEQQLKERAASISGLTSSLPSISAITNFAQSPKGLPMAAAAAWGNWRKARDFSLNAVSDIATNISQTPSKSNAGSPSGFLAGIMTPPSTSQRTPPPEANPPSPTMRPLASVAAARKNAGATSEARPLRTYSTQARTLSSRQAEKRRESAASSSSESSRRQASYQPDVPSTPTTSRSMGSLDLGDDVDEDASPFDASQHESEHVGAEPVAA